MGWLGLRFCVQYWSPKFHRHFLFDVQLFLVLNLTDKFLSIKDDASIKQTHFVRINFCPLSATRAVARAAVSGADTGAAHATARPAAATAGAHAPCAATADAWPAATAPARGASSVRRRQAGRAALAPSGDQRQATASSRSGGTLAVKSGLVHTSRDNFAVLVHVQARGMTDGEAASGDAPLDLVTVLDVSGSMTGQSSRS